MLELNLPVNAKPEVGRGRIDWPTQRRTARPRGIQGRNWANALAVIGERIVWWLSAVVRSVIARWGCEHDNLFNSRGGPVGTGGIGVTRGVGWPGGRWAGGWLQRAGSPGCRRSRLTAAAFFVGADEVPVPGQSEGVFGTANRQTLRNRELGQLGQREMWLKRYKTGMFANLANLAKQIRKNGPVAAGQRVGPVRSKPPFRIRLDDEASWPPGSAKYGY